MTRVMDTANIAWVAGIIEGEATISNHHSTPHKTPFINVRMCDEDVIKRLQEVTGFGTVSGPYIDKRKKSYKPSWSWQVSKWSDFVRIGCAIAPILGERRRGQLLQALEIKLEANKKYNPRKRNPQTGRWVNSV